MRTLLDTDVVSQLSKECPHAAADAWIRRQAESNLFLSVVTLMEIRFGIECTDQGRKRGILENWLVNQLTERFAGRILSIEPHIADIAGHLLHTAQRLRIGTDSNDALIAATALAHGMRLATLNRKHFEKLDLDLVDLQRGA